MDRPLITVVETPTFIQDASEVLTTAERVELINHLSAHPRPATSFQAPAACASCGGPLRACKGKRGGARVIYYHLSDRLPLFLLTVYGKGEKGDLSAAERKEYRQLVGILVKTYGRKTHARSRR